MAANQRSNTADLIQLASFERFFEASSTPLFVVPRGARDSLGRARPNPALGRRLARVATQVADRERTLSRLISDGEEEIRKVLAEQPSAGYRSTVREGDGPTVWSVELSPLSGVDGQRFGVVGAVHQRLDHGGPAPSDLGADASVREGRLSSALSAAGIGTWTWGVKTGRVWGDARFSEILGGPARPVEMSLQEFLQRQHPDERSMVRAAMLAHVAGRTPMYRMEHRSLTESGAWRWLSSIGRVYEWTKDEDPALVSGILFDISARKAAEAEISRMGREYREIVESIPGVVYRTTSDELSSALFLSEPFASVTGYCPAEFVDTQARSFDSLVDPRDRNAYHAALDHAVQSGSAYEIRYRIRTQDGGVRWIDDRGLPKREPGTNEVKYLSGVLFDISEMHEQQVRLALLEQVVESSNDGVLVTTGGHPARDPLEIVYVNGSFVQMSGYPSAELLGASLKEVVPLDAAGRKHVEEARGGEAVRFEIELKTSARNTYWGEINVSALRDLSGEVDHWVFVIRDVSERKRHEFRLRLLESAVENASDGIVVADLTEVEKGGPRVVYANPAFQTITGYPIIELYGENLGRLTGQDTDLSMLRKLEAGIRAFEPSRAQFLNYTKEGAEVYVDVGMVPLADEKGVPTHWLVLYRDVTERWRREAEMLNRAEQLRLARDEAERATQAKSAFLATMSHEIRTPMNGVIGMTSLLLETQLSGVQKEFVDTIRTSGDALLTLINDILDFSKIEAGQVELEEHPFRLPLCVEEALELVAPRARAKGLRIGYTVDPDVPWSVSGDVTRLRQVLVNLVGNAVKFTENGSVHVGIHREADKPSGKAVLRFSVEDTGIGIPQEGKDKLFSAFTQMDASISRRFGGTGLGLAISRQLVELMGGVIEVESEVGQGSTFWFTVEMDALGSQMDEVERMAVSTLEGKRVSIRTGSTTTSGALETFLHRWGSQVVALSQKADILIHEEGLDRTDIQAEHRVQLSLHAEVQEVVAGPGFMRLREPLRYQSTLERLLSALGNEEVATRTRREEEVELGPLPSMRVLLVEDNAVNQKVALNMLQRLGLNADVAANGQEAVDVLARSSYDVVLMDMQMPVMDGLTATRLIREKLPAHRQPRIVALTANAMDGDAEACLEAGMDDYLSKPIRLGALRGALELTFDNRGDDSPEGPPS